MNCFSSISSPNLTEKEIKYKTSSKISIFYRKLSNKFLKETKDGNHHFTKFYFHINAAKLSPGSVNFLWKPSFLSSIIGYEKALQILLVEIWKWWKWSDCDVWTDEVRIGLIWENSPCPRSSDPVTSYQDYQTHFPFHRHSIRFI